MLRGAVGAGRGGATVERVHDKRAAGSRAGAARGYLCAAGRLPPITQQGSSPPVHPPVTRSLLSLMDALPALLLLLRPASHRQPFPSFRPMLRAFFYGSLLFPSCLLPASPRHSFPFVLLFLSLLSDPLLSLRLPFPFPFSLLTPFSILPISSFCHLQSFL